MEIELNNENIIEKDWRRSWEESVRKHYPNAIFKKEFSMRDLPKVSPHWPGVGKYIGVVDDEKPVLFTHEEFNKFDYWDKQLWQKNRVYSDEIPIKLTINYINRERFNKSIPEMMYNVQRYLDIKLIKFFIGEK